MRLTSVLLSSVYFGYVARFFKLRDRGCFGLIGQLAKHRENSNRVGGRAITRLSHATVISLSSIAYTHMLNSVASIGQFINGSLN